jgi:hypothetical protein
MRRLALFLGIVPLLTGCFFLPGAGWSDYSSSDVEQAQSNVRAAIPAMEAWYAEHGTYAGLTLERLRQDYDPQLPDVTLVGPLNRKTYCVESTAGGVSYFKPGPAADILEGQCGDAVPEPVPPPPPLSYDPQTNLRTAIPAIEAWRADHETYAGMTLQELRAQYDYGIPLELRIVRAGKKSYCAESTVGGDTWSYWGPRAGFVPGGC